MSLEIEAYTLLACPFCGQVQPYVDVVKDHKTDSPPNWHVACGACCARIANHKTKEEAITAWNQRQPICPSCDNHLVPGLFLQKFPYRDGNTTVWLEALVTLWICPACGEQILRGDSEAIREKAIDDYIKMQEN